jgi:endo-1,4-beta-xylanase
MKFRPVVRAAGPVLLLLIGVNSYESAQPPSGTPSLREEASQAGILIGTAVRSDQLSEQAYASTLAREFNMIEAEDAMKWWAVRPARDTFDFGQADRIVDFAQAHGMQVRGHTLVWGRSNPSWVTEYRDPQALHSVLQDHIRKVAGHFRGKVFAWDVVNEAFDEKGRLRSTIWYDQPGIGFAGQSTKYIEQAFGWAHEADPDALLFYNDAEGEGMNAKSDAIYAMVKDFRSRGVPIDGVGLQMHIFDRQPDLAGIEANIARFTSLRVQVHITEMDVALPTNTEGTVSDSKDLEKQAEIYRAVARICVNHPGCTAIQTWGFTDKYSWIRSTTKGAKGVALLFDRDYRPKPAYFGLRSALSEVRGLPRSAAK